MVKSLGRRSFLTRITAGAACVVGSIGALFAGGCGSVSHERIYVPPAPVPEDIYGPPEDENIPEPIYGPPEEDEEIVDSADSAGAEGEEDPWSAMQDVYGPPVGM